jgi:GH35 family endo-1,4-beta-xylanase
MKNFTKNYYLLLIFFLSCSGGSDSPTEIVNDIDPEPDKITDSFKKILSDEYNTETFKFGATLNYYQFNSNVEDLFLKEFDYLVAENSFKQTIVHPEPDVWNWERVDAFIDFANKNNLQMRVHGPIGPQSSTWAKNDSRTKEELIKNYEEFLTELCKKINVQNNIKWMDVVNETIDMNANWTIEKDGTGYQNPWTQIGENEDGIPFIYN